MALSFGSVIFYSYIYQMKKVVFISIEAVRQKREALITKRNDLLLSQRYTEANKLLPELNELNEIFNKMLKEKFA